MRPNPVMLGHLGLEILMGVRLAKVFRAPLWLIRPSDVVGTAMYELRTDEVRIRVISGRLADFLDWAFLDSAGRRKEKPLLYGNPIHFALTERVRRIYSPIRTAIEQRLNNRREAVRKARKGHSKQVPGIWRNAWRTVLQLGTAPAAFVSKRKGKIAPKKVPTEAVTGQSAPAIVVTLKPTDVPQGEPSPESVKKKKKKNRVLPIYFKRMWIDQYPPLHMPESQLADLQTQAEKNFGIAPDTRLITLHMREPGFKAGREIHEVKPGARDDSTRNVSSANYFLAIDHLRASGFTVVRIGDRTMTPIHYPGVLDLATSPHRTDLLEFYCVARSAFFIGCESGGSALAWVCRKPVVILNATDPVASFPFGKSDIFTVKNVRRRADGHLLSLIEMMSSEYFDHFRDTTRFEYLDNSPEDVRDVVAEMLQIIEHGMPPETPEQREYRLQALSFGVQSHVLSQWMRKWGPHHGFLGRGRIAASFARKYMRPQREAPGPLIVRPTQFAAV
jgi:putative glycosyltransferase (TIGR04372 family)